MSHFDIEGKVAIISGASKGIGQAIAQAFADSGAKVTVSSRKMEGVSQVAKQIEEAGGEAMALQAHMGYQEQVDELVNTTLERWGHIDIAVNNAATNPHFGPLLTAEESQLDKIFDTNLKGYFRLCKTVYPHMQAQKSGKIINLSSVAGIQPGFNMGVYSISKSGVIMLTKALARELGPENIQVNAIAPGIIKTKFSRALWESEALMSEFEMRTPLKRIGLPEDVVGAALYLASPASDWVTGTVMVIDGGSLVAAGI